MQYLIGFIFGLVFTLAVIMVRQYYLSHLKRLPAKEGHCIAIRNGRQYYRKMPTRKSTTVDEGQISAFEDEA